ncbi:Na+/H+ antiporter NhaD and related arsenite permease-like protein [Pseudogulbenkiania sp. NH8B]|uniref:sodium:proton antiporter n=1 Tax=Pseudogulbenkiania sp. (strain NH8B) TaxID=748280 RepID=UPI0002279121|nr:sodium:proton antiporter [Pseudogulbenkiania sp. NH8B]BAK75688.1 Na+/H+ antiporter NhaD and related arsenite permease-like protein [Pseudogulbenkiania sp. NH8B]
MTRKLLASALLSLLPALAQAAELDGASLSLLWALPFCGILLSIALFPIFAPGLWHHHFGKITALWSVLFLLPFTLAFGPGSMASLVVHALLAEYLPFIVLLLALYTVSGGILLWGNLHGSPRLNTALLAVGTLLASVMGTTGAAMLLIRPLLKANDNRRHNVHVVVFFIFLVANVGGGLTPLGDPPLFLGFLKGVDFFWTIRHMGLPVLAAALALLAVFYLVDSYYYRKEGVLPRDPSPDTPLKLYGQFNFLLIAGVVGAVLLSGLWKPGLSIDVLGTPLELQNAVRDLILLLIALLSLALTPRQVRAGNDFNWAPMLEVGKLFAGIFITIGPAIAILRAGSDGHLAALVALVSGEDGMPVNAMYFWLTGLLSSFLDNAPTYLVFFNLAAGDAQLLMKELPQTLLAISMGAVFMGAMTYIGNAPNFMVKAIAEQRGVAMPGFFGFLLWSGVILLPLFVGLTWLFF